MSKKICLSERISKKCAKRKNRLKLIKNRANPLISLAMSRKLSNNLGAREIARRMCNLTRRTLHVKKPSSKQIDICIFRSFHVRCHTTDSTFGNQPIDNRQDVIKY